jgi:exopolysaccharide biosynthesis polyprenyl glycosylphosphotransferase
MSLEQDALKSMDPPALPGTVSGGRMRDSTLILGSREQAKKLYNSLAQQVHPERIQFVTSAELSRVTRAERVSKIVIADSEMKPDKDLAAVLIDCKLRGIKIESGIDSFEKASSRIWLEGISPQWLIFAQGFAPSRAFLAAKRLFDCVLSAILLLITAPLMAVIAAAIRLDSPGPVIFSQERVGLRGKIFTVFKFRSMRVDAESASGPIWARDKDDRVTRVGNILRKCRFDELPQLVNVFRGEMSFVGPRPERPYFVEMLKRHIDYYDLRHYVKPGITGWAQVKYPYGASVEDAYNKLEFDLYYAKNMSFRLDVLILLKTIGVVAGRDGR